MEYKRMGDYGSEPVVYAEEKLALRDKEREELRAAEEKTVRLAKLVAAEAWDEAHELLAAITEKRKRGLIRDESLTAKNLATIAGIATDKALILEGRPNTITARADATESWDALYRIFSGNAVIESSAVEVAAETDEKPELPAPAPKTAKKRGRPPKGSTS